MKRWRAVLVAAAVLGGIVVLALRGCPEDAGDPQETADSTPPHETSDADPARRPPVRARASPPPAPAPAPEEPSTPAPVAADPAEEAPSALEVRVVRDSDGAPVEGALVTFSDAAGNVRTDATGSATVLRPGPRLAALDVARPAGRAELARMTRRIVRVPGSVTVRVGAAVTLRGRIHAGGVRPRQVAANYVLDERSASQRPIGLTLAEDGSFSEDVGPGRFRVWTEASGPEGTRWHHPPPATLDPAHEEFRVELREAEGFSCTLVPEGVSGGALLGAVYASPSGGLIEFRDRPEQPAFGSPIHTLRVEAGVPHDVWAKVAAGRREPAAAWGVAREVMPGSRAEIAVRPAWTLRIAVVDAEGMPFLQSASLAIWPEGSSSLSLPHLGHFSEIAGEATVRGLPPLPARIYLGGLGTRWCCVDPPRVEPGTESVVVTITKTEDVVGTLHDVHGRPLHAVIRAIFPWPSPDTREYVDVEIVDVTRSRDGQFTLRGLPPGRVKLRWSIGGLDGGDLGEVVLPVAGPLRLVARDPP